MYATLAELHGDYSDGSYGDLEDDLLEEIEEGEANGVQSAILMGAMLDATADEDFDDVLGLIVDGDDDGDLINHIDDTLPAMMGSDEDVIELMGVLMAGRKSRRRKRKARRAKRKARRRTRKAKRSDRRSNRRSKRKDRRSGRKARRIARRGRRKARKQVRRQRRHARRDKRAAKWAAETAQSKYAKQAAEQGVSALEAEQAFLDQEAGGAKSGITKFLLPAAAIGAAMLMGS